MGYSRAAWCFHQADVSTNVALSQHTLTKITVDVSRQYNLVFENGIPTFGLKKPLLEKDAIQSTADTSGETEKTEGKELELKRKNKIWDSPLGVYYKGVEVGTVKFRWNNDIEVRVFKNMAADEVYTVREKGFWQVNYVMRDGSGVFVLSAEMVKRKWLVLFSGKVENEIDFKILLLLFGYSIALIRDR